MNYSTSLFFCSDKNDLIFVEASAKDNTNVNETFDQLLDGKTQCNII